LRGVVARSSRPRACDSSSVACPRRAVVRSENCAARNNQNHAPETVAGTQQHAWGRPAFGPPAPAAPQGDLRQHPHARVHNIHTMHTKRSQRKRPLQPSARETTLGSSGFVSFESRLHPSSAPHAQSETANTVRASIEERDDLALRLNNGDATHCNGKGGTSLEGTGLTTVVPRSRAATHN